MKIMRWQKLKENLIDILEKDVLDCTDSRMVSHSFRDSIQSERFIGSWRNTYIFDMCTIFSDRYNQGT